MHRSYCSFLSCPALGAGTQPLACYDQPLACISPAFLSDSEFLGLCCECWLCNYCTCIYEVDLLEIREDLFLAAIVGSVRVYPLNCAVEGQVWVGWTPKPHQGLTALSHHRRHSIVSFAKWTWHWECVRADATVFLSLKKIWCVSLFHNWAISAHHASNPFCIENERLPRACYTHVHAE